MSDMDHEVRSARMLGCEISTNPLDPLEPILKMCEYHHPDEDMSILARAYRRAVNQHSSQRRKSGEPYIIHPLAVAQILADLGMGPLVVAAGLLHDTVEDTDYTLDECRAEFGDTVTGLVDGVTKLSKMEYGDSAQAETIRKMVVAMSRDVRVLVVKRSNVFSVQEYLPGCGCLQPGDQLRQRCFPAAVGACEHDKFSVRNSEVHTFDNLSAFRWLPCEF